MEIRVIEPNWLLNSHKMNEILTRIWWRSEWCGWIGFQRRFHQTWILFDLCTVWTQIYRTYWTMCIMEKVDLSQLLWTPSIRGILLWMQCILGFSYWHWAKKKPVMVGVHKQMILWIASKEFLLSVMSSISIQFAQKFFVHLYFPHGRRPWKCYLFELFPRSCFPYVRRPWANLHGWLSLKKNPIFFFSFCLDLSLQRVLLVKLFPWSWFSSVRRKWERNNVWLSLKIYPMDSVHRLGYMLRQAHLLLAQSIWVRIKWYKFIDIVANRINESIFEGENQLIHTENEQKLQ